MKNEIILIFLLFIVLFAVNYRFLDNLIIKSFEAKESVNVERVIDGDTIVAGNKTIRLLGINTPERGERYYQEAKDFLISEILNKTVYIEYGKERKDKYGRTLAYVFFAGNNIDMSIVEKGFANYYFPSGKDKYYYEFKKAWESCLKSNKNLCEKSEDICADCIKLEYKQGEATLINTCSFSCDTEEWTIKGEGRSIFEFENNKAVVGEQDTLFLRDEDGKLVLWKVIE